MYATMFALVLIAVALVILFGFTIYALDHGANHAGAHVWSKPIDSIPNLPSRQTPMEHDRLPARAVAITAAALALVLVGAPASAGTAKPRVNEGWISLVSRTCGSSNGWQRVAAANGAHAPHWWLPLRSVTVNCPGKASGGATKSPAKPSATGWVKPGPGGCSDGFGYFAWRDARPNSNGWHYGQDIRTGYGARVVAAAAGRVTAAGWGGSAGYRVWINHGGGVETVYMHASRLYVHEGQTVKAGQLIAKSGSTGDSTAAHLHFGVRVNGKYVNPKTFMSRRGVRVC